MSYSTNTPVLIVGAGPVGLSMSIELSQRGIANVLIDQGDGALEHPRTGLIAVRTMEMFRRWGLAERIRSAGFPDDYELSMVFCTSLNGFRLDKEFYPSMRDTPTPPETPEKKQRCPQLWMQPILTERASREPLANILYGHRFESLEQDDTGVSVRVTRLQDGTTVDMRAQNLLACDGATSLVREQLGIPMSGKLLSYSVNILFKCPGLVQRHKMGQAERYLFVGPEGTWGNLTVVDGNEIWRMTVLGNAEKMDLETFDGASWVRRALGDDSIPFEIQSVQPWRRSAMLAEHFVRGRVILAGDAVHTMSPTGGMGMNTGMQEVLDLGWKLEATIKGWGGPKLISSYEQERRPVSARNIDFSTANFNAWLDAPDPSAVCQDTAAGDAARKAIGKRLRDSTRAEWESMGLQIGYRYEDSPICVPDGTPATADDYSDYIPTSRPGSRAPHAWLPDGRSTLDLFNKDFVLLAFSTERKSAIKALKKSFDAHRIPLVVESISVPAIANLYERSLVLVRPDGHVAWRGDDIQEADSIVQVVRGAAEPLYQ